MARTQPSMRSPGLRLRLLRSPRIRRLGAIARGAVDLFPFTPLGLVTVAAAVIALTRYGIGRADLLYLVIGAAGIGLGAIALLTSTLTAIGIRLVSLRADAPGSAGPLRLECGVRAATGFSLPALGYVPLVRARWSWARPAAAVTVARERGRLREEVTAEARGMADGIERRIEVSDAFALTRIAFLHRERRAVRAVPSTGALARVKLPRSVSGGEDVYDPEGVLEGERIDLRGYAPGDPIRFVLWKVFARTGQLVVRTPERAQAPARRAIAYVVAGRGDEAAAGVARRAVESGALGASFVIGADGVRDDGRTEGEALDVLARSAGGAGALDEAGGAGLAAFLDRASGASATSGAWPIVFVPALDGPWVARVVAAARGARVQIVVCTDGLDRGRAPSLVRRLLFKRGTREAAPPAREVEALAARLGAGGAGVLIVDRAHGQVYSASRVGRLRRAGRAA